MTDTSIISIKKGAAMCRAAGLHGTSEKMLTLAAERDALKRIVTKLRDNSATIHRENIKAMCNEVISTRGHHDP